MARSKVDASLDPLDNLSTATQIGAKKGLIAWAKLIAQRATLKAPVATSQLAQSIFATETFIAGTFNVVGIKVTAGEEGEGAEGGQLGTNLEYAAAQELGSGLHGERGSTIPIRSKPGGPPLAFEWEGAPAEVEHMRDPKSGLFFFRSVEHPGVKAQPYLRPAFWESFREGLDLIATAIIAEWQKPFPGQNTIGITLPSTGNMAKSIKMEAFRQQISGIRARRKFGGRFSSLRNPIEQ